MANKVDIRIVKSKESLMSALVSLLQKKKLEDLSISEVCQEANVNRNTFYSHYTNIRELFEEMKGQYLESLLSSSKVFLESNDSVNRTLLNVLEKMKAKDKLTKVILSEARSTTFLYTLLQILIPQLNPSENISNLLSDHEYSSFVLGGVANILMLWVSTGFKESPKTLSRKLATLIEELNNID